MAQWMYKLDSSHRVSDAIKFDAGPKIPGGRVKPVPYSTRNSPGPKLSNNFTTIQSGNQLFQKLHFLSPAR